MGPDSKKEICDRKRGRSVEGVDEMRSSRAREIERKRG
jgi:hypothetical protein